MSQITTNPASESVAEIQATAAPFRRARKAPAFRPEILRSLRMHPLVAMVTGLVVFAAVLGYALTLKPLYKAESRVYVEPAVTSPLSDASAGGLFDSVRYDSYLQQQMETATRVDILKTAIQTLPANTWILPGETLDAAAHRLSLALKVARVTTSYQMSISLSGGDPQKTAAVVNAVTAAYLDAGRRDELSHSTSRAQILTEERDRVSRELSDARAEQASLGAALGVASPGTAVANPYDEQLAALRAALVSARQAHDAAAAQLTSLAGANATAAPGLDALATEAAASDSGLTTLKSSVTQRRAQLEQQMATMTPANNAYKLDQQELADLDKLLAGTQTQLRDQAARRVEDKLRAELERTGDIEARINSELARGTAAATSAAPKLERSQELIASIARLNGRFATIDDALRTLELETHGMPMVHLSLAAAVPTTPEPGKRKLFLLASLPLALLLACLAAIVLHRRERRIFIAQDMEDLLGFTPIAVLPARTDVSNTVIEEYVLRLAGGVENAYRTRGARVFVLTPVSATTSVDFLTRMLSAKLTALGLTVQQITATDLLGGAAVASTGTGLVPSGSHDGRMGSALDRLKIGYDLIFIAAPALLTSAEAEYVARTADATILVTECGVTLKEELMEAALLLENLQVSGVGTVLDQLKLRYADRAFRNAVMSVEARTKNADLPRRAADAVRATPAAAEPAVTQALLPLEPFAKPVEQHETLAAPPDVPVEEVSQAVASEPEIVVAEPNVHAAEAEEHTVQTEVHTAELQEHPAEAQVYAAEPEMHAAVLEEHFSEPEEHAAAPEMHAAVLEEHVSEPEEHAAAPEMHAAVLEEHVSEPEEHMAEPELVAASMPEDAHDSAFNHPHTEAAFMSEPEPISAPSEVTVSESAYDPYVEPVAAVENNSHAAEPAWYEVNAEHAPYAHQESPDVMAHEHAQDELSHPVWPASQARLEPNATVLAFEQELLSARGTSVYLTSRSGSERAIERLEPLGTQDSLAPAAEMLAASFGALPMYIEPTPAETLYPEGTTSEEAEAIRIARANRDAMNKGRGFAPVAEPLQMDEIRRLLNPVKAETTIETRNGKDMIGARAVSAAARQTRLEGWTPDGDAAMGAKKNWFQKLFQRDQGVSLVQGTKQGDMAEDLSYAGAHSNGTYDLPIDRAELASNGHSAHAFAESGSEAADEHAASGSNVLVAEPENNGSFHPVARMVSLLTPVEEPVTAMPPSPEIAQPVALAQIEQAMPVPVATKAPGFAPKAPAATTRRPMSFLQLTQARRRPAIEALVAERAIAIAATPSMLQEPEPAAQEEPAEIEAASMPEFAQEEAPLVEQHVHQDAAHVEPEVPEVIAQPEEASEQPVAAFEPEPESAAAYEPAAPPAYQASEPVWHDLPQWPMTSTEAKDETMWPDASTFTPAEPNLLEQHLAEPHFTDSHFTDSHEEPRLAMHAESRSSSLDPALSRRWGLLSRYQQMDGAQADAGQDNAGRGRE